MMMIAMAMTMTTVLMLILTLKSTLKTIGGDNDLAVAVEVGILNFDFSVLVVAVVPGVVRIFVVVVVDDDVVIVLVVVVAVCRL